MWVPLSKKAKTVLALFLLGFYLSSAYYGNLGEIEARPPSSPATREQKPIDSNQGGSGPTSDKRADHRLESINQSWLAEIQSRVHKKNRSVKQKAAPSPSSSGPAKQGAAQVLAKERMEGMEQIAKYPVRPDKKLYLANPGNAEGLEQVEERPQISPELNQGLKSSRQVEEAPSFVSAALRFVLFISLLGLLIYFGLRFFRSRKHGLFRRGDDLVQLLVSVPLVQGKFLQIVDVAGQLLVLGVSDAGVQLLTNINEGISADRIRLWQSRQSPEAPPNNMTDKLTALLKGTDLSSGNTSSKRNFASLLRQFGGQPEKVGEPDKASELKRLLIRQKKELSRKNS